MLLQVGFKSTGNALPVIISSKSFEFISSFRSAFDDTYRSDFRPGVPFGFNMKAFKAREGFWLSFLCVQGRPSRKCWKTSQLSICNNNSQGASTLISPLIITMFRCGFGFRYYPEPIKQNSTVNCRWNYIDNNLPLFWHMTCFSPAAGSKWHTSCICVTVIQSFITAIPRSNGRASIPTAMQTCITVASRSNGRSK